MNKQLGELSTIDIFNKSGRSEEVLKNLQKSIRENAEVVDLLEIKGEKVKIQTSLKLIKKCSDIQKKMNIIKKNIEDFKIAKIAFINELIISELESTNEIEGISTERKSIKNYINHGVNKNLKEKNLINHYFKILSLENNKIEKNEDIRKIYEGFLKDYITKEDIKDLGKNFRKYSVDITNEFQKTIHKGVEGEENIEKEMKNLMKFLNNEEEDIIIRISIFHYYFGYIHPFYDGNGRINRLITSMYLFQSMDIACLSIAKTINNNKKLYYKMFDDTNDTRNIGDVTYFVYQFIEILNVSLDKTISEIDKQNKKLFNGRKKIEELYGSFGKEYCQILFLLYQGYVIKHDIDIKTICSYTDKSRPSIESVLKILINEEKIKRIKKSKKYVYRIDKKIIVFIENKK